MNIIFQIPFQLYKIPNVSTHRTLSISMFFLPHAAESVSSHDKKTFFYRGKCRLPNFKKKLIILNSILRNKHDLANILHILIGLGK